MRATYTYDVFGNRIQKDVWDGTTTTTTRYAVDGWKHPVDGFNQPYALKGLENFDVWAELDGSNALVMRRVYGDGIDQPLARVDGAGTASWYHQDRLGSVVGITNNSGTLIDSIVYDGFLNVTSESSPSNGDDIRGTGRLRDAETGLQLHGRREFNPRTGTWIEQDPDRFGAGDANLSRYVGNNPTNKLDPSGLKWTIYRNKHNSWATVTTRDHGDTLLGLASQLGLQPRDMDKWLRVESAKELDPDMKRLVTSPDQRQGRIDRFGGQAFGEKDGVYTYFVPNEIHVYGSEEKNPRVKRLIGALEDVGFKVKYLHIPKVNEVLKDLRESTSTKSAVLYGIAFIGCANYYGLLLDYNKSRIDMKKINEKDRVSKWDKEIAPSFLTYEKMDESLNYALGMGVFLSHSQDVDALKRLFGPHSYLFTRVADLGVPASFDRGEHQLMKPEDSVLVLEPHGRLSRTLQGWMKHMNSFDTSRRPGSGEPTDPRR